MVSLERGDRVVASLKEVAHNHELTAASISGIGGINDVTVAYYNLYEKRYIEQNFSETYELLSCDGNVAMKDGEHFIHTHVSIADVNYQVYGGHLMEATVAIVGEFVLDPIDGAIARLMNDEIGLAVWNLEEMNSD